MFKITLISKTWLFFKKGHHTVTKLDTLLGGTGHIHYTSCSKLTRVQNWPWK